MTIAVGLTTIAGLGSGGEGEDANFPTPFIATVVEPPEALCVMVSEADLDPVDVGVNVKVIF